MSDSNQNPSQVKTAKWYVQNLQNILYFRDNEIPFLLSLDSKSVSITDSMQNMKRFLLRNIMG